MNTYRTTAEFLLLSHEIEVVIYFDYAPFEAAFVASAPEDCHESIGEEFEVIGIFLHLPPAESIDDSAETSHLDISTLLSDDDLTKIKEMLLNDEESWE